MINSFWKNKSVLITGHTGFKGGWICHWLSELGAKIHGYALVPSDGLNLYDISNLREKLTNSVFDDIRNLESLSSYVKKCKPEIIIHMAAQPLVREGYINPHNTFETNVMGLVNLYESVRNCDSIKVVINVTTDKCYKNKETIWSYREYDELGGDDPYSASKACSELISNAYVASYFSDLKINVATARAGNVIGGGDWSPNRLIPDFFRAVDGGKTLNIRYPNSIRPWQHVLEPLNGYIKLAEKLYYANNYSLGAWNFGSEDSDAKSVSWIVKYLNDNYKPVNLEIDTENNPHESSILKLDSSKSKLELDWRNYWSLPDALKHTIDWHESWRNGEDMSAVTVNQICQYGSQ